MKKSILRSISNIDISSKLTKDEMKRIMAGSGCGSRCTGPVSGACGGCRCINEMCVS